MAKLSLSDAGLRSIAPPAKGQRSFWDTTLPSFGVRVSQGGSKTFVLNRDNSLITIGRYGVLTLSQARTEAKRLLAEFTLGKVRPQTITYDKAVEEFLEEKRKARRERTVYDYERLLNRFGFKGQLAELTHPELQRRLKRFTAPAEYNHLLVALKVFCNWAIKRRYIEHNPTLGLSTHARKKRSRVLSDAELQSIWRACEHTVDGYEALPANFTAVVKLLILCGQRKGETAALRTSFVDGTTVTLPDTLTKNHRTHAFPLAPLAAEHLRGIEVDASNNDALFFPARGKPNKPLNGWSKNKEALDKLSGVTRWTYHDIRRTFRSNLGRLGVAPHIAERVVNHVSAQSEMEQTYDVYRYIPEMLDAMTRWESHLRQHVIT